MRYALMREMDISNGEAIGVSLFVQGCHLHCPGCFNPETWDFAGGEEWTPEIKETFLSLIDKPYIKRVSILGGEPFAEENQHDVLDLLKDVSYRYPRVLIWVYTGYSYEDILFDVGSDRRAALNYIDTLVAGPFEISKQDLTGKKIKWAGSTNQRVIDVQNSLNQNKLILYKGAHPGGDILQQ